mgnify:CR=1 FL=1
MIDKARLEHAQEMLRRNVAYLIHFAMWHRGVSLAELERRLEGRVTNKRLHKLMMGDSREGRISDLADIMTVLDMRIDIQVRPNEIAEGPGHA